MDLSETTREVINRHPWELSRTQCTLKVFSKYIAGFNGQAVYIIPAQEIYILIRNF